ncbi:MAG: GatB/YqeY domain-containing protein [Pyramidobacter sp.]|nr:GatB/YqeY domain-containing protein [Pyramidobacter sp.]
MSALTDRVSADLKTAMKERREPDLSVYRMLKSELQKFHADKGLAYEISDDDVLALVRRLVKQRKEAAEQYLAGGAADRAQAELAENKVLEAYLPAQLGAEEVESIVRGVVAELGASSPKDMGKVMGSVMPKVNGRADGKLVRETVQRVLQGK